MVSRISVLLVVLLWAPVAFAQSPTLRDINSINGFDSLFDSIEDGFRTAPEQFPGDAPPPLLEAWEVAREGAFQADRMLRAVEEVAAPQFSAHELAALHDYFSSDLGMRISVAEIEGNAPGSAQLQQSEGAAIRADLAASDPERLVLYDRMLDAISAVDTGEAIGLNMVYAMMSGMLGAAGHPATDEQILAITRQSTANMRQEVATQVANGAAWTYRETPIEDLRAYVDFLETPVARRYYSVTLDAIDRVVSAEARTFGHRIMIGLGQRKA